MEERHIAYNSWFFLTINCRNNIESREAQVVTYLGILQPSFKFCQCATTSQFTIILTSNVRHSSSALELSEKAFWQPWQAEF